MYTINTERGTEMDKSAYKKIPESEIEDFMAFRKKGYYLKNKKGKGSYSRKDRNNKRLDEEWYEE